MNHSDFLKGKNAFVSGASGGIGSAIVKELAECGCNLFLTSQSEKELNKIQSELSTYNINVAYQNGDLRNKDDIYKIIDKAKSFFGAIEIVVNTAGVFPQLDLQDSQDDIFEDTMNINLRSAFIFSREFSKEMITQKWGRIVNIGSVSSYFGYASTSVYCVTKHGLLGLSRSINGELKQYNVRSFCISPSSTKTKMGKMTLNQNYDYFLETSDIAKYVIFVISFEGNILSDEIMLKRMKY